MLLLLLLISPVYMVKHQDFKTCVQSAFCVRQSAFAALVDHNSIGSSYSLVPSSLLSTPEGTLGGSLMGLDPTDVYVFEFSFLSNSVRFRLTERDALYPRYDKIKHFVIETIETIPFSILSESPSEYKYSFGDNTLIISSNPFRFTMNVGNVPAISWNEKGYFYHEDYRLQNQTSSTPLFAKKKEEKEGVTLSEDDVKIEDLKTKVVEKYWEESFGSHTDLKPKGNCCLMQVLLNNSRYIYFLLRYILAHDRPCINRS